MSWYAAHVVLYVKYKKGPQSKFPVWENVFLIEAATDEEAFAKAEARAREDEGDCDGSFRWGGRPATWVFAGIRKLVSCDDPDERPGHGSEVTYTEMQLDSEEAVRKMAAGEAVTVELTDEFPVEA